jgi:hypothetical protein
MTRAVMLSPIDIEYVEAFAAEHGLAAALDRLGLDGLGNEVAELELGRLGTPDGSPPSS